MTLMDAYACRLDKTKWFDGEYFDAVEDDLQMITFKTFAAHHCVGLRTNHRNKIKKHQKDKTVVVFTPRLSSNPSSRTYTDYCRYSLMKYVPWDGQSPSALWGGDDATEAAIQKAWEYHLQSYKEQNLAVPDFIRREVEEYYDCQGRQERQALDDAADPDDLEQEPWQADTDIYKDAEFDPEEAGVQWDRERPWVTCGPSKVQRPLSQYPKTSPKEIQRHQTDHYR